MIKVNKMVNTCVACPSQWKGITNDNQDIYIRYRWGHLSICFMPSGKQIFDLDYGDDLDGFIEYATLKKLTANVIEFPEYDEYNETY